MNRDVSIAAFCAVIALTLFGLDYYGFLNRVGTPIARLDSKLGSVRRLAKNDFAWDHVLEGSSLAQNDAISTGEFSRARIRFFSGGEMDLDPGTMVLVSQQSNEVQLKFLSGGAKVRVKAKTPSRFRVTYQDKLVAAKAAPPNESVETTPKESKLEEPPVKIEIVEEIAETPAPALAPVVARSEGKPDSILSVPIMPVPIMPVIEQKEIRHPAQALKSEAELMQVKKPISAPELVAPLQAARVELLDGKGLVLNWENPTPTVKPKFYEVTLRSAEDAEKSGKFFKTKELKLDLGVLAEGKYVWSVRSVIDKNEMSAAAQYRWFEITRAEEKKITQRMISGDSANTSVKSNHATDKFRILPVVVE